MKPLWEALPVLVVAASALAAVSSCAIPTNTSTDPIGDLPTKQSFLDANVSGFMEIRCGTLDCHGQDGRPLRIYGKNGLRKDAKNGDRSAGTTDKEKSDNYYAVVGLEPENMAACFQSKGQDFATFQLLKKPLDIVGQGIRHKGGPVLRATQNDNGWQCIYGWVSGKADKQACDSAANVN